MKHLFKEAEIELIYLTDDVITDSTQDTGAGTGGESGNGNEI